MLSVCEESVVLLVCGLSVSGVLNLLCLLEPERPAHSSHRRYLIFRVSMRRRLPRILWHGIQGIQRRSFAQV